MSDPIIITEGMLSEGETIAQFVTRVFETQEEFIFETIRPFCEERTGMTITKDELIRALTLLREQERGGWASVQDEPPKKSGWYLVSLVNTRTGHRWKVPVPADYSHGKWDYAYLGTDDDPTWIQNNTVTHWMPLPEPPEEVQK